jgi:hypothetical protein
MIDVHIMQERAGKGDEMGTCLAQPCQHGVRINGKHPRCCPDPQAFGQGRHYLHEPLGWVGLAVKERAVRLQKIRITHHAVELPPSPTPRMTVRTDIAQPDPAIIGAQFPGTVLGMGIDRPRAAALGGDYGRR